MMKSRAPCLAFLTASVLICASAYAARTQDQQPSSTPTPSIGTRRTDLHGIAQVYVPAGCFMMGSDPVKDPQATSGEQPQHQVCITHSYWLDAYEVTNAAYQAFIDAGGYTTRRYWSEAGWSWKGTMTAPDDCGSQFDDPRQPRVCITWYEAEAYAQWRGGRLPTEAEWEYAARGPESLIYPWGNAFDGTRLNACDENCAQTWADKSLNDGYATTSPVGHYESGKSWVNAYDMAGNVWEWVNDWYGGTYYRQQVKDDPQGPDSAPGRVVRGGGWGDSRSVVRAAVRGARIFVVQDNDLGFRVAAPAP